MGREGADVEPFAVAAEHGRRVPEQRASVQVSLDSYGQTRNPARPQNVDQPVFAAL